MTTSAGVGEVREVLLEAQRLGFLGDRPIDDVIEHSRSFVRALLDVRGTVIDLGAGGGVPGLVVAADRPDLRLTLLDRRQKRTDFLERVTRRLGWADRVTVVAADVDRWLLGVNKPFDAAIARGFGPAHDTLRTGAALVGPGGRIVISEPPVADRWPSALLAEVGVHRLPSEQAVACFERR